jgi:large subunit ribosomal protein L23
VKSAHEIIVQPYITERSVGLSQGSATIHDEKEIVRKYTFLVALTANKIQVKQAIEDIYNAGKKKKDELIIVTDVHTSRMHGKKRRVGKNVGHKVDRKKAIVTLAKGQMLEDYGV